MNPNASLSLFNKLYSAKDSEEISKITASSDFENQYIDNYKLLYFLKTLQGEENNTSRIEQMFSSLNLKDISTARENNITLGKDNNKIRLDAFIMKNYLLKYPEEVYFKNNNNNKITVLQKLTEIEPENVCEKNGIQYYCLKDSKGEVKKVYAFGKVTEDNEKKEFIVPKTIEMKDGKTISYIHNLIDFKFLDRGVTDISFEDKNIEALTIGERALFCFKNLKTLNIPDSVESLDIGEAAFEYSNLTKFNLENNKNIKTLKIGANAFYYCKKLSKLVIPISVTTLEIGEKAFAGSDLTEFNLKNNTNITTLKVGAFAFNDRRIDEHELSSSDTNSKLSTFSIPNSITKLEIGDGAFATSKLTEFNLKDINIKTLKIGDYAFCDCWYLSNFVILNSVEFLDIGEAAFRGSSLKNFNLENTKIKTLKIGIDSFNYCKNLYNFVIPNSVENIDISNQAFIYSGLQEFNLKA